MPTPNTGESEEEYVKRCIPIVLSENEGMNGDQAAAICHSKYAEGKGDSAQRKIGFDRASLDDKVLVDDDNYLVMPAVIASEIVHQYEDGWAYKSAEDLRSMAETAAFNLARPVKILSHPDANTNYLLIKQSDIYGRAENFHFVKNLKDAKTGRPMRRGVTADIRWMKSRVPEDVLEKIRSGAMRDVSIGFTFDYDDTEGTFNGVHYDFIQRNLFLDHVAAPIEAGRCPGPICGIGYDSARMIQFDAQVMETCPVCRTIKDVGFSVAGKRLMQHYGVEVLEVIEGNPLPAVADAVPVAEVVDLDREFNEVFSALAKNLDKT
jgi:hypothetical protein